MNFKTDLIELKSKIDDTLNRFLDNEISKQDGFLKKCYERNKAYIMRGGKRLRPIACIKAYQAVKGKVNDQIIKAAISLELFHASSLIHDDIMDEDDVRRGEKSMHKLFEEDSDKGKQGKLFLDEGKRYGSSIAIIQGNILFSLGLKCITKSDFHNIAEAFKLCHEAYQEVNDGQLLDIDFESKELTEKDYMKMANLKTGKLFSLSVDFGALFADANDEQRKAFREYAENAALGFQIQDDLMDISKDMKKGNTLGSDIKKGKMTLMVIKALEKGSKIKVLGKLNATEIEIENALKVLQKSGAIDYCKNKAKECVKKAKEIISIIEDKEFFDNLADYMVARVH
jgi:geranylgeranyl diphosphate synthase, type I